MLKRDEFVEQLREEIEHLNLQLRELEAGAERTTADGKQIYLIATSQLSGLIRPMEDLMRKVGASGGSRWDQLKVDADEAYQEFIDSYNCFKLQLR